MNVRRDVKRGLILLHMLVSILLNLVIAQVSFSQQKSKPKTVDTYAEVLKLFGNPPSEFRSAPLWVWNDRVTNKQIDEQLTDFHERGIGGVFIHPRPGLITEYLSDEWFALCQRAVKKGKELGMKVWIYDENSYPSGFAGGHVPAQMPDAVRKGLGMARVTTLPATWSEEPLVVLQRSGSAFVDITANIKSGTFGPGEYYVFTVIKQVPNPWYGGFTYVDLMQKRVTEKFIDVTMNAYKKAIGAEFGKTVPGVFQDEAEVNPASLPNVKSVSYTPALFEEFKARWNYDLRPHLPSLYEDVGDWPRVRHNYYSTILDLFIEGWAKPYYDYCTRENIALTGHYWEHEWPRPVINPDNLGMSAFAHMPGIDILMNEFTMDTHGQFGNARAVKEIRSVANQLGRQRTMSETFGAGGWDMTFFDQKRIADWELVLGVNFINQHLSYMTIKGARKTDHPLSFSYHEPWWNDYNILADYFGRLSVAMSLGDQINRILVIEPTTTAWMHYASGGDRAKFQEIEKGFQGFVNALEAAQVEYDLGSERTIRDHAKVVKNNFVLGERAYELVVLPPTLANLDHETLAPLARYLEGGGNVLCYGAPPGYVDGQISGAVRDLATKFSAHWVSVSDAGDVSVMERMSPSKLSFQLSAPKQGNQQLLFHHRRTFKDFELLLLVNTSDKEPAAGTVTVIGKSCEEWDGMNGTVKPYPATTENGKMKLDFSIERGGSLLLCIRPTASKAVTPKVSENSLISTASGMDIKRIGKNVLVIDYCDLTLNNQTEKDQYFYQAQTKAFQAHGLTVNPWDHAVQYKKNIVEKDKFGPDSGFEATYSFTVGSGVKKERLQAVVESPELYKVSVNGKAIVPLKNKWWLDKAFGVFEIGQFVTDGENRIVVKSSPFTIHTEIQPIFILGDFLLESREKGFAIVPEASLKPGSWVGQGMPFYGDKVGYAKNVRFSESDLKGGKVFVRLGSWSGVAADVLVNGKKAGMIGFEPFELDISRQLKPGTNEIEVLVCGSLKNTLGPHHNNPPLGRAWPGQFQQGAKEGRPAGSKYSVVEYGLMEEFKLIKK